MREPPHQALTVPLGIPEQTAPGRSRQVVRKRLAALRAGIAEPVRADIPSPRKITFFLK
ncbi:hypothetical protein OG883_16650 [Streptomyces sp. NBC_01142]|uniref:hypothetical protein n=1 Tax=Streptomyces sp. NBC_01142 TaxID=2975865 RepID=UPI00224E6640|nr:hypothetical protein [Streptomyces sp. NBC_01142]MCX4821497.1 hypothetical protein [Streptomyces sp. NBC_01142]